MTKQVGPELSISTTDAVLIYDMDTLTGGLINDFSGGDNDGTITGATDEVGYAGRCRLFDGGSDWIVIANESNFDFERTDAFSIALWVFPQGTPPGDEKVLAKQVNGGNFEGWMIDRLAADDTLVLNLRSTGSSALTMQTQTALTTDVWTHVVATYDGSSTPAGVTIWLNGVSESLDTIQNNLTTSILNNIALNIGRFDDANTQFYEGRIDELLIFTRVLTAKEIEILATENPDIISRDGVPVRRRVVIT